MSRCAEFISNESPQVIGVISGIHDDMPYTRQPFNEAARLRTVAPLTGRDRETDRQAKGVNGSMYLGGQATFGATNTGSFKPPF